MTDLPPLPEAATSIYPIEEPPHTPPTGPNGEPLRFAMDADAPEPAQLTGEAKALLGVVAAVALGTVTALAATLLRKRQPRSAPIRRRKTAARKPGRRAATA